MRYAALNLTSLLTYGSLEFRSMRTPTTAQPIIDWVNTLHTLMVNSKEYEDPVKLLSAMSANGEREVVSTLLGPYAKQQLDKPHFEEKLYYCLRNIQFWVFLNGIEHQVAS